MLANLKSGVVGVLVLGGLASADVVEFVVLKSRLASQVSTAAPTVAHTYEFEVELEVEAGDAGSADVNGTGLAQLSPEDFEYTASFPNQAALDLAFPAGTNYSLNLQGGALGSRSETVSLPTPPGFPSIPALTPTSYQALITADASQNLLLQWNTPTGTLNVVAVEIQDTVTQNSVVNTQLSAGQTSLLVPAGTMTQNQSYDFRLIFANANFFNGQAGPTGFGTAADGIAANLSELQIPFQTSAPTACVDLNYYDVVKARHFEQTSNATTPAQPSNYEFFACIESAAGASFASASLTAGAGLPQPLNNPFPGEWAFEMEFFGASAKANMDAAFPNPGNFTLAGSGGSLGTRTQTMSLGADAYPPVPVLLGTSFSDLQGMDVAQALSVSWGIAGGSTNLLFVEIYDVLLDDEVFDMDLPIGTTSFVIPAGLLQGGRAYEFHVYFANATIGAGDNCPGFGTGSEEILGFLTDTRVAFTTESSFDEICNGDGGDQMGCTDCPCGNNAAPGTAGGCLNSAASSARLVATGDASVSVPSMSSTDLRFALSGAPGNAFCILNSGDGVAPGNMANPCFGMESGGQAAAFDGLRCAIMNTRRHGGRSADGAGNVGVTNNPWGGEGGPPVGIANAGGGFTAGQTRYFQVINRDDPLAGCLRGLNTSQAVRITFTP